MLSVDSNFKLAAKSNTKSWKLVFTQIGVVGTPLVFGADDILQKCTFDAAGTFNGSVGRQAVATLLGNHPEFEKGQDYVGVLSTSYSGTWYNGNVFHGRIAEVSFSEDLKTTIVTLQDWILNATNTNYDSGALVFPLTIAELALAIANLIGTDLNAGISSLPFYDYVIPSDVFSNQNQLKLRDVITAIAQATATNAIVDEDGNLDFRPISITSLDTLDGEQLFKLKIKASTSYLNQLALTRPPAVDAVQVSDETSIIANGLTPYQIPNNQIMNASRADFMADLFAVYDNFVYYTSELTTTGLGYFEVGDMITVTSDTNYDTYISEIKSMWSSTGFQEDFVSSKWNDGTTNQAAAGGILTSLLNAQLLVDHALNTVTTVVEQYDDLSATVASNYTSVQQDIDDLTITVQQMGGINLIQDSVGYLLGNPNAGIAQLWTQSGTGTIAAQSDNDSTNFGAISANSISMNGASPTLTQLIQNISTVNVYSLSLYIYKGIAGSVSIHLTNGSDDFSLDIASGTEYGWVQFKLENLQPTAHGLTITITASGTTDFKFTDLLLNQGPYAQEWGVAQGEAVSANAIFTSAGLQVKSTQHAGDLTQMTPLGFSGFSSASGTSEKVLSLDRDATKTKTIQTGTNAFANPASTQDGAIDFNGTIVAVPIEEGIIAGLSFIPGANA